MANIGDIIDSRYKVIETIASGSMGIVYKVQDTLPNGRIWAMKEFVSQSTNPYEIKKELERFRREAETLAKLDHPNIPKIDNYFDDQGKYYIIMQFIEGENVENILKQNPYGLSETTILSWFKTVLNIINHYHSQNPPIIYRDCKPGNFILDSAKKLWGVDAGIAVPKSPTNTGAIITSGPAAQTQAFGTPQTVAPEQINQADERTDIFNIGATFFWLSTGQLPCKQPFQAARDISVVKPSTSPWLAKIINKMLAYYPEDRYQSVAEIMAELPDNSQAKISKNSLPSLKSPTSNLDRDPYFKSDNFRDGKAKKITIILVKVWENGNHQFALKKINQLIRRWFILRFEDSQMYNSFCNIDDNQALVHLLHYKICLLLESSASAKLIENTARQLARCKKANAQDISVLAEVYEAQGKYRQAERQYQKIAEKTGDATACKKLNEMQIKIEERRKEKLAQKKQQALARKQKLQQAITALQQQPAIIGNYLARQFNPANSFNFNWFVNNPFVVICLAILTMTISFVYHCVNMSMSIPDKTLILMVLSLVLLFVGIYQIIDYKSINSSKWTFGIFTIAVSVLLIWVSWWSGAMLFPDNTKCQFGENFVKIDNMAMDKKWIEMKWAEELSPRQIREHLQGKKEELTHHIIPAPTQKTEAPSAAKNIFDVMSGTSAEASLPAKPRASPTTTPEPTGSSTTTTVLPPTTSTPKEFEDIFVHPALEGGD